MQTVRISANLAHRIGLQDFQIDEFQCRGVSGGEFYMGGHACLMGFQPALEAEAPKIARPKAGESEFRHWRAQIVALDLAEG